MSENILESFFLTGSCTEAINYLNDCKEKRLYNIALETGKYFLEICPKNFDLLSTLINIAFMAQKYDIASEYLTKIWNFDYDDQGIKTLLNNISIFIPFIKDNFIYYNSDKVKEITERLRNKSDKPLITFTITTCKRYDLFEKTINSFINCCQDIHRIDKWFLVDDNSSEEDRQKMREKYPFFQFYFKNISEKGHPQSMNIIRKNVTTPFIFHMEDDWQFVFQKNYISNCLEVLSYSDTYGQCLINKNYGETERDINIIGGILQKTKSGLRYYEHEFCKDDEEFKEFYKKYGLGPNSAYWRHFSFRPSLMRKYIIDKLGEFNENISHFEADYSHRYQHNGYISVFLEGINSIHIGRLTSEINDSDKINAYKLNNEKQFYGKEELNDEKKSNYKTYILNLQRRSDRWENFIKNTPIKNYEKFIAIDGSKLQPNDQLQRIFENNDYFMREGMVGCALSHIKLCIHLLQSDYDFFLVLEDDVTFVPDFNEKLEHLIKSLPTDWDLCYIGHHLWPHNKTEEHFDKNNLPIVYKKNHIQSLQYSIGGTTGYLITKKGAELLLEFINKIGMMNCIDTMQQKSASLLNVYYCKPHLIYSDCCTNNETDTDIQKNFRSLDLGRQGNSETFPERLKVKGKFNIDSAIKYEEKKTILISVSETTHVSEALKSDQYPFDKTDGGSLEDFVYYVEKAFYTDLDLLAKEFLENQRGIIFPHEKNINKDILIGIYKNRFTNFVNAIKSDKPIIIVYATRWRTSDGFKYQMLYEVLSRYNKNIKILSVNGIDKNELLFNDNHFIRKYIDFPERFHNDDWDNNDKIYYDQTVYRVKLKDILSEYM